MRAFILSHIFKYKIGGIIMKLRKHVTLSLSITAASLCIAFITPAQNVNAFEPEITLSEFEESSLSSIPSLCFYSDQDPRVDK